MTFDPIPDDMWEDWKWFVYPEGRILGMREGRHRINNSGVVLTPCYIVNLPKLIMSDVMWASRLESTPEGPRDTNDYLRPVRVSADSLIENIIFLLSQYPMVVSRKVSPKGSTMEERIKIALERGDDMIMLDENGIDGTLSMNDLDVQFFNPFSDDAKGPEELIGVIAAEGCINELSMARADAPDSTVRQVLNDAIAELSQRGLVEAKDGAIVRMTEKGKRLLELEPVVDALSCRCETEAPNDE
ncbi:MAG: hypothetical protein LLG16_01885 [Euryarchaeota archaeon]|nr:hypothetical protein [Euryarchaeota archaeon]